MAVSAAVGLASLGFSAYKYFKGKHDDKVAERERNQMNRPFYKVRDQYYQNVNQAEELATEGLPLSIQDFLEKKRQQKFSSSVSALKDIGVTPGAFEEINRSFDESVGEEASMGASQKIANIKDLMTARKDLAGQLNTAFGLNELQPFENKLAELTKRRQAAQTNENNALSEGISSLSSIATSATGDNGWWNQLFGKGGGGADIPFSSTNTGLADTGGSAIDTTKNLPDLKPQTLDFSNS